jgi:hypothetical protein
MLELFWSQFARASTAMPLLNSLRAIRIPVENPSVDTGAMNVKQVGDLRWGMSIGAEQESLKAQSDAWGFVGLRFLAQDQELPASSGVGLGKNWCHGNLCCFTYARIMRQPRRVVNKARKKGTIGMKQKREKPLRTGLF